MERGFFIQNMKMYLEITITSRNKTIWVKNAFLKSRLIRQNFSETG